RPDFRSAVELRDGRDLVIEPGVIPRVGDVDERFPLSDEILHESARRDGESHRRREIHALPLHLVLILSLYFSHGKTTADPPGTIAFRGLPEGANLGACRRRPRLDDAEVPARHRVHGSRNCRGRVFSHLLWPVHANDAARPGRVAFALMTKTFD